MWQRCERHLHVCSAPPLCATQRIQVSCQGEWAVCVGVVVVVGGVLLVAGGGLAGVHPGSRAASIPQAANLQHRLRV